MATLLGVWLHDYIFATMGKNEASLNGFMVICIRFRDSIVSYQVTLFYGYIVLWIHCSMDTLFYEYIVLWIHCFMVTSVAV